MRAGFAVWDVTPPLGAAQVGGLREVPLRGCRDPLRARAVVLGEGDARVAVVGVDILWLDAQVVGAAREQAQRLCGIRPERVLIAASHTHQGAAAGAGTASAIASAVATADARAREAWLAAGVGRESGVSFNRRFRLRQGVEATHPGKGNPDILEPAGPVDPDVGVLSAWDPESGDLLGCLVNFACHATTLGGDQVSADWIHHLDRTVRGVMGPEAVVVFLAGASGDVTQVDNRSRDERDFGERASRIVGQSVGAEVLKVLARARRAPGADEAWALGALRRTVALDARRWPEARLARARATVAAGAPAGWDAAFWRAERILRMEERAREQPAVPCEVQVLQVGSLALVANPTEYFCALGLEIKAASPFAPTFVVTLANGALGYAPPTAAFGADGGGYEQGVSRLAVGSAERIREASLDLLREAWRAQPVDPPVWPPVPVGRPWDMGAVRGGD